MNYIATLMFAGLLAGACAASGMDVAPGLHGASAASAADAPRRGYAPVTVGRTMAFPADYGSHADFRTEWWYVTGWLKTDAGESLGFQVTFFRTAPDIAAANPSSFTPRQLLIAHCAISDPKLGRLWQDQRVRRAGLGLAEALAGDTDVWIDRWSLKRGPAGYVAHITAEEFAFDLTMTATQGVLVNGEGGVSRKGPTPGSASYYYSQPHLRVTGNVQRQGSDARVSGEAWLDHEWSSEYLDSQAVGWDWIGLDLDDGAALMLFRIRGADGQPRWSGGSFRGSDGNVQILQNSAVQFTPVRRWRSPRTGISYPVEWQVRAGSSVFQLEPLLDDQENDTRLSTGAIYWEGAVRALQARREVGRGYLELTGYGERLRLR